MTSKTSDLSPSSSSSSSTPPLLGKRHSLSSTDTAIAKLMKTHQEGSHSRSLSLPSFPPLSSGYYEQFFPPEALESRLAPSNLPPPLEEEKFYSQKQEIAFCTQAKKVWSQLPKNPEQPFQSFSLQGTPYTILENLGRGQTGRAFKIHDSSDGKEKVLKINLIATLSKGSTKIRFQLANELFQYYQFRTHELPVAIHENLEPLLKDPEFLEIIKQENRHELLREFVAKKLTCGYYIVEYIPEPFPKKSINEIPAETDPQYPLYVQLRDYFQKLYDFDIPADATKPNIRIKEGKIVNIDLHPYEEEIEEEGENAFSLLLPNILFTFTWQRNSPLWNFLYPRIQP